MTAGFPGKAKRGLALPVALLVLVVIVLVGSTYLVITATESRIAVNEVASRQALYAAESGARVVTGWFERSGSAFAFPTDPTVVERRRSILDPSGARGVNPSHAPEYKEAVDRDDDGQDDLFRRPFRGAVVDTFLGTEDRPDMRIEEEEFLEQMSRTLFQGFPGRGARARLRRIDILAPPYVMTAAGWAAEGIATVRVSAVIESGPAKSPRTLARRTLRLVVQELPYLAEGTGVVHACGDASVIGPAGVRWGRLLAAGDLSLSAPLDLPAGPPRAVPGAKGLDRLWTDDASWVSAYSNAVEAGGWFDPWVAFAAGGRIPAGGSSAEQPFRSEPPPDPAAPPPWSCCDRSNVFQHQGWIDCPEYDYVYWKRVAQSGRQGARYYAYRHGGFVGDGVEDPRSIEQILSASGGRPALYFFDTLDGEAPADRSGDGRPDNLTPVVRLSGRLGLRGVVFLNAEVLTIEAVSDGMTEWVHAPAEPRTPDGRGWIDLRYPERAADGFRPGPADGWDRQGPRIEVPAAFRGILVTSGDLAASGGGTFIGNVVARSVVLDGESGVPTRFFRDLETERRGFPPDWSLPRVSISRWAPE